MPPSINRKMVTKRQRAAAASIIVATFIIVYIIVAVAVTPLKYDIKPGDVSPATITASREVVDTESTEGRDSRGEGWSISGIYHRRFGNG